MIEGPRACMYGKAVPMLRIEIGILVNRIMVVILKIVFIYLPMDDGMMINVGMQNLLYVK